MSQPDPSEERAIASAYSEAVRTRSYERAHGGSTPTAPHPPQDVESIDPFDTGRA